MGGRFRGSCVLAAAAATVFGASGCRTTPSGSVNSSVAVRDGHEVLSVTVRTSRDTAVSVIGPGRDRGCSGPSDRTASYCTIELDGVAESTLAYTVSMTTARPRLGPIPLGSPGHAELRFAVERPLGAYWSEARRRTVLTGTRGEVALDADGRFVLSNAVDGAALTVGGRSATAVHGEARVELDVEPAVFSALVSTGAPPLADVPGATIAVPGRPPAALALRVDPAAFRAQIVARMREAAARPEARGGAAMLWVSTNGETELYGDARSTDGVRYVALDRVTEAARGTCGPYSQTASAIGGARVPRVAIDVEVRVVDRSTGAEVARRRFAGPAPTCPSIVTTDQRRVVGAWDIDAIRAWLLHARG